MNKAANRTKSLFRKVAQRGVIAALPVAMVAAYSTNFIAPTPPRLSSAEYDLVAEIVNSATTVGIAASSVSLSGLTAEQIGEELDDMLAIGVTNIRIAVPWGSIDYFGVIPEDNPFYGLAWANMDAVISEAAKRNMGVLAEINATPPGSVINGLPGTGTPDPADFANFLQRFIDKTIVVNGQTTTYGDVVSAYEIWNEPNSIQFSTPVDPEAYAQLLATAYPVIKNLDSSATVVAGAVGTVQDSPFTMNTVTFVQRMLDELDRLNASSSFDALSVHPYSQDIKYSDSCPTCIPGLLTPREQVEMLKAMIDGRKIWITEYGLPTYDPPPMVGLDGSIIDRPEITEAQQSEWIRDLLQYWKDHPEQAGPIFLYTGRDTVGALPTSDEGFYGLWKLDPLTGQWVLKTAGEMLEDWLDAGPTDPTDPTDPPDPGQALAQFFATIAQQIGQALASIGPQIVQAIVQAVANWLGSLGQPAAATEPQTTTLRIASVEAPETDSLVESASTEADTASDGAVAATESKAEATAEAPVESAPETETAPSAEETPAAETPASEAPAPPKEAEPATPKPVEPSAPTTPADTATEASPSGPDSGSSGATDGGSTSDSDSDSDKDAKADKADKADKKAERAQKRAERKAEAAKAAEAGPRNGRAHRAAAAEADTEKPALTTTSTTTESSDSSSE